ncbi:NAD-dependent epimerase/dehydratase family protein [Streptomyces albiaxialis]|uniref:NAD-dependent epimerase/dehydratase family protein n=1 Tax=Streptomyces albiaxialis TaxID=329523 RepID=UPI0031DBFF65
MRLLVLGGTEFVGRAVVEAALGRGWEVTVFHRGRHEPPPGVGVLHGDRTAEGGLKALSGPDLAPWDAVVDTWSGAPTAVRDSARLLADRAGRYVYVSSGSVYAFPAAPGRGEDRPVVEGSPDDGGDVDYARAKRGGELAATDAFGERALLVRAGLILGPWENIGRLPWWLNRVARGGEILAPGPPGLELQYIDVRDLADWTLDAAEAGLHGPYGLVSPPGHTTMRELMETMVRVTGADAELRWADPDFLTRAGVEPWTELPVWVPPGGDLYDTLHRSDVTKALAAGLRCRPFAETAAGTWEWLCSLGGEAPLRPDRPRHGLAPEREAELLRSLAG